MPNLTVERTLLAKYPTLLTFSTLKELKIGILLRIFALSWLQQTKVPPIHITISLSFQYSVLIWEILEVYKVV